MPTALIELGFHTNMDDSAALRDSAFRIVAMRGVEKGYRTFKRGGDRLQAAYDHKRASGHWSTLQSDTLLSRVYGNTYLSTVPSHQSCHLSSQLSLLTELRAVRVGRSYSR